MPPPYHPWIELEEREGYVYVVRTDVPFCELGDVDRGYGNVARLLEARSPRGGVLIDLRRAPGRNDPAFEKRIAPIRKRMFMACDPRAVLVQTAIGALQVRRHAADDGMPDLGVFTDLDEADVWLRSRVS